MSVALAEPTLKYIPQDKQDSWHACPAYESGYGGAKFGGKTLALLMESARGIAHPAYRGIVFRRTYPRLQEVIDRSWQWFPGKGGHWQGDQHRWVFPSGASISMRHCQYEESKYDYQGHEYQFMGFDQLEEFTESQYTFLLAQNRSGSPELKPYTRSTFNPGGIGHAWVKARFIDHATRDCAPWRPADETGRPLPLRCFHFSTIEDNPKGRAADPGYEARLDLLPENDRRALKGGDWDVFAGQVFSEWRRARHVVEPFTLPAEWRRWRAVDYGIARPFVCLWLCRDPATLRVYVYRELSRSGVLRAADQARMILEAGPEAVRMTVADPAMWERQAESGRSIAALYAEAGVRLVRGANDRLSGLQRVHHYLGDAEDGKPRLLVFSTCRQLVKNLPALVHDQHRVEDVDTDGPDDEYDALRYGLMADGMGEGFLTESIPFVVRTLADTDDEGPDYEREMAGQRWPPRVARRGPYG